MPVADNKGDTSFRTKLSDMGQAPKKANDILWNFEKFLISREGKVVARFASDVAPDDPRLISAIEQALVN